MRFRFPTMKPMGKKDEDIKPLDSKVFDKLLKPFSQEE